MNWLLAHPDRTLADCAEYFGYTPQWVRRLVNTDLFQAVYRARAEAAGVAAVHAVKDKLVYLAGVTLDEAARRIESGQASERFLGETLRTTLASLGYASQGAQMAQQQNVHLHIDPQVVVEARERALEMKAGRTGAKEG